MNALDVYAFWLLSLMSAAAWLADVVLRARRCRARGCLRCSWAWGRR